MHRHERAGARRDRRLDLVEIDVARVEVDVDEHRARADAHDDVGGGDEAQRRRDHLVARPDAAGAAAPSPDRRWRRSGCAPVGRPDSATARASSCATCGPLVIQPERSTSATAAMVSSSMLGTREGQAAWITRLGASLMSAPPATTPTMMTPTPGDALHVRHLTEQPPGQADVDHIAERQQADRPGSPARATGRRSTR